MPIVNGKKEDIGDMTFFEYLTKKGYEINKVVIECNLKVIKKEDLTSTKIGQNDKIEILSFVGGG